MALQPNDPYEAGLSDDEILRRRTERFDNELQADPELAEGPASGGRVALFAIAFIAILGVVFYGLNNPSTSPTSTAQTTTSSPANPAGGAMKAPPGQTTGSVMTPAPAPAQPPAVNNTAPPASTAPAPAAPSSGSSSAPTSN
jgi:hypothetical protein